MQEKHLFEYAVIRVVPRVEREEFLNVGVIVYCPAQRFLKVMFQIDEQKLRAFCAKINITEVEERLRAFDTIASGIAEGATIAMLPIASRFRWLTAARSTILQTSPVHPGLCANAGEKIVKLFGELVL